MSHNIKIVKFIKLIERIIKEQGGQCTYERNTESLSSNYFCSGKAVSISYSECLSVYLLIQHAMRMRRIISSSVVCVPLPYFSTYLINGTIFRKKVY
jgi:hypothetical protein